MAHLILIPTPIGNLEDITLRALRILAEVDVVAAEDTRHSNKLLNHYKINKPLIRLDAYTVGARAPKIFADYQKIAYLTDAGTPGISDPGTELVQFALKHGDKVEVIPGATALIPALVLSGLPLARFTFEGFLPRKGKDRLKRLDIIAKSECTSCFYESPKRLLGTLQELKQLCGKDRKASVSREITKKFESTYRGTLESIYSELTAQEIIKGEVVVVISPSCKSDDKATLAEQAMQLKARGIPKRDLQKALMALGASRNLAYELSLKE